MTDFIHWSDSDVIVFFTYYPNSTLQTVNGGMMWYLLFYLWHKAEHEWEMLNTHLLKEWTQGKCLCWNGSAKRGMRPGDEIWILRAYVITLMFLKLYPFPLYQFLPFTTTSLFPSFLLACHTPFFSLHSFPPSLSSLSSSLSPFFSSWERWGQKGLEMTFPSFSAKLVAELGHRQLLLSPKPGVFSLYHKYSPWFRFSCNRREPSCHDDTKWRPSLCAT